MSLPSLLDTPKRAHLQSRTEILRANLKDFERSFAALHGKKPGKNDIKANEEVSKKYKEYNKLRDVLAGKIDAGALEQGSPKRKRQDKPVAEERKRRKLPGTPQANRVVREDLYGGEGSSDVEEDAQLTAIGPTPQRDGMVMGLFDMMSNPGSGRHLWSGGMKTPGGIKRKVDVLGVQEEGEEALVAATPEQRRQRGGDLLQFLGSATPATGRAKHSRTPISEGRKFLLNQFFATPSAVRYSQIMHSGTPQKGKEALPERTPLKNHVLGLTPRTTRMMAEEKDKTPNYLKRSHSFKDRLLSASTTSASMSKRNSLDAPPSPVSLRSGPSLVKARARFQPKPLSQIAAELKQCEQQQRNAEGGDDDGMDALRELEDAELNTAAGPRRDGEEEVTRVYKKKGQKRTTRRVIMRPQPKLPAKEAAQKGRVEVTQLVEPAPSGGGGGDEEEWSDDELFQALAADDDKNDDEDHNDDDFNDISTPEKKRKALKNFRKQEKSLGRQPRSTKISEQAADGEKQKEKQRTYNPNATAHMNFKTLKIKNKNSKGKFKGRGGRFGGRRR